MTPRIKTLSAAALAALTIGFTLAETSSADARYYGRGGYHRGYHRHGIGRGAALGLGLAAGALALGVGAATANSYYGGGYGGYGGYGYPSPAYGGYGAYGYPGYGYGGY